LALPLLAAAISTISAQQYDPKLFGEMRWRSIGPYRGGRTFQKVLYKDENTGGSDLEFDPANPDTVYAALWESRQGPWENGAWSGTGGGIFKSTDSGAVEAQAALQQLRAMRAQVKPLQERAGQGAVSQALAAFDQKAAALEGTTGFGFGGGGGGLGPGGGGTPDTLATMGGALSSLMGLLQGADVAPTSQLAAAVADRLQAMAKVMERWNALKTHDLEAMNAQLGQANLGLILIK
jgi:hypothetical protein